MASPVYSVFLEDVQSAEEVELEMANNSPYLDKIKKFNIVFKEKVKECVPGSSPSYSMTKTCTKCNTKV